MSCHACIYTPSPPPRRLPLSLGMYTYLGATLPLYHPSTLSFKPPNPHPITYLHSPLLFSFCLRKRVHGRVRVPGVLGRLSQVAGDILAVVLAEERIHHVHARRDARRRPHILVRHPARLVYPFDVGALLCDLVFIYF